MLDWAAATLNRVDRAKRKDLGVWYTPTKIVDYIYMVERVDRVLREELALPDGLADPNVYALGRVAAPERICLRCSTASPRRCARRVRRLGLVEFLPHWAVTPDPASRRSSSWVPRSTPTTKPSSAKPILQTKNKSSQSPQSLSESQPENACLPMLLSNWKEAARTTRAATTVFLLASKRCVSGGTDFP